MMTVVTSSSSSSDIVADVSGDVIVPAAVAASVMTVVTSSSSSSDIVADVSGDVIVPAAVVVSVAIVVSKRTEIGIMPQPVRYISRDSITPLRTNNCILKNNLQLHCNITSNHRQIGMNIIALLNRS